MTNLKKTVTDFLNSNRTIAEELMTECIYDTTWAKWEGVPFEFKSPDSYGGEGQGSDYWTVLEVRLPGSVDETLFIKLEGWYSSYIGVEYSGWSFVTPKQKTITVYD